jgi:methyl-accepting chemotaxis protein
MDETKYMQRLLKPLDRLFGSLMKNVSIKNKLLFFFLLISLGPILIIGSIVYTSSRVMINNKITDYSINTMTKTAQHLELVTKKYEEITYQMIASEEANKLLIDYVSTEGFAQVIARRDLERYFNRLIYSDSASNIFGIIFSSINGQEISLGVGLSNEFKTSFKESTINETVYKAEGGVVWFPPVMASVVAGDHQIIMGRTIKNPKNGKVLGNAFLIIKEETFDQVLNDRDLGKISESRIKGSYTLLVDKNGQIISSPLKHDINGNIFEMLKKKDYLRDLINGKDLKPGFRDVINGKSTYITFKQFPKTEWYLLEMSPTSYLYYETRRIGLIILLLGVLSGLISVIISLYVSYTISNSLENVVLAMGKAEDGDLTARIKIETADELGMLGNSFNNMIKNIGKLIMDVKRAIDAVQDRSVNMEQNSEQSAMVAETVASAMEEISRGTMEQTTESENTSKLMSDLAILIDDIVGKVGEIETITGSTKSLSYNAQGAVELLIEKTKVADKITHNIVSNIDELNNSAQQISGITEAITNIAEQTNLLALNAAIEAARAGEAGRGFAVVADEVNKLATQTEDAVKVINNILKNIASKTQSSKSTVEQIYQVAEEQSSAVTLTQKAFGQIISAMDNVVKRMSEMTGNFRTINQFKDQTANSIINISAISEETAASAEEVTASSEEQAGIAEKVKQVAEELHSMAEQLVGAIAQFNVDNESID